MNDDVDLKVLKGMVMLAGSSDAADRVLAEVYSKVEDRKAFLEQSFDYCIIARRSKNSSVEREYMAVLSAILGR